MNVRHQSVPVRAFKSICDGFAFYRLRAEQEPHPRRPLDEPGLRRLPREPHQRRPPAGGALRSESPLRRSSRGARRWACTRLVTDTFMQNAYTLDGGRRRPGPDMGARLKELGGEIKTNRRVTRSWWMISAGPQGCVPIAARSTGHASSSAAPTQEHRHHVAGGCCVPGIARRVLNMEDGVRPSRCFSPPRPT